MKSVLAAVTLLASAASTLAQSNIQSAPFYLVAHTNDAKYNGTTFGACHEGAALESLCPGGKLGANNYETYQFNTSAYQANTTAKNGVPGLLTFELHGGNFNISQAMSLSYNPASNVAVPLFGGAGYGTQVAFDSANRMNIQTSLDDTKGPGGPQLVSPPEALYRWYICDTLAGYNYTTLAWVSGKYPPENPSCVKTQVVRVFA